MVQRALSVWYIALLTLLILDAGVVPTAAIRLGSDAKSMGTDSLLVLLHYLQQGAAF